eukprot:11505672-Alexandrium_andersonii.AAC.1
MPEAQVVNDDNCGLNGPVAEAGPSATAQLDELAAHASPEGRTVPSGVWNAPRAEAPQSQRQGPGGAALRAAPPELGFE